MGTIETQLVVQTGILLVKKLLESGRDTTELENELAQAETLDDVKKILMIEVAGEVLDDIAASPVLEDLVKAKNSEEVKLVVAKPNFVEEIFGSISHLIMMLFRGQK